MSRGAKRALLIVDMQFDFLPGGALEVHNGDEIIPVIIHIAQQFETIIATQDWHPERHKSFASSHVEKRPFEMLNWMGKEEMLWPDHCVQGSEGAKINPEILALNIDNVLQKGTDPDIDSYSAFFDNHHQKDTGLDAWLKNSGIRELYVCGLATDYCVKYTVLNAIQLGYKVVLFTDAIRGVNLFEGNDLKAMAEMEYAGAILKNTSSIYFE